MSPRRRLEDFLEKVVATSISDQSKTSLRPKLRRFYDVFATSSRSFPDVFKTSLRRLKTSPRLFLVKTKSIYGLSIYVCFKLQPLHHWQTNCIGLNSLHTLKHGNNAEIVKTWFSLKCQTRKYFFQELKYFFSIRVSHKIELRLSLLKFVKRIRKGY